MSSLTNATSIFYKPAFVRPIKRDACRVFQSGDFLKAPYFYENLGIDNSLVGMTDPAEHRVHRNIVNPMFSARSIQEISHGAIAKVKKAADLMRKKSLDGKHINIQQVYRCITACGLKCLLFAGLLVYRWTSYRRHCSASLRIYWSLRRIHPNF